MFVVYSVGNGIAGMIKIKDRQFVRLAGYLQNYTWANMESHDITDLSIRKQQKGKGEC